MRYRKNALFLVKHSLFQNIVSPLYEGLKTLI